MNLYLLISAKKGTCKYFFCRRGGTNFVAIFDFFAMLHASAKHTHTHTHTNTLTHPRTQSHSQTHSHTHVHSHIHKHTHTNTHNLTYTLSLSLSYTHTRRWQTHPNSLGNHFLFCCQSALYRDKFTPWKNRRKKSSFVLL